MTKAINLKTKPARKNLPADREPHWFKFPIEVMKGGSLGFRRSNITGQETWHGRLYLDGKYLKTNLGTVTPEFEYKQAYKAALDWAQKLKDAGPVIEKEYTLQDILNEYLTHIQGNSSPRNMDRRRQAEKRLDALLNPAIKRRKVRTLSKPDLTQLQREYSQRTNKQGQLISPDSVNRVFAHLIAALNRGFKEGMIPDKSAWQHYERLQGSETQRRKKTYFTPQERDEFLSHCPEAMKSICTALNLTGARPSELRRLRVADVDLIAGEVKLTTYKGKNKVGTRFYPLPADSKVRELFTQQVEGKEPGNLVFTTQRGMRWGGSYFGRQHIKVRTENSLSDGWEAYSWRHARLTDWCREFPVTEVANIAGTSIKYLLENYYHTDADLRSKMASM